MRAPDLLTPAVEVAERSAPGRASQDRHLVLPHAVVVLDGATDPQEPEGRDGGWYAEQLGTVLRDVMTLPDAHPSRAVETAISEVVDQHALRPGRSPSATVAMAQWDNDVVTAYVLGDSAVIAIPHQGPTQMLTDRLRSVATDLRHRQHEHLAAGHGYDQQHVQTMHQFVRTERAHRNRPGGYWIAETDPGAARHGQTTTWSRPDLRALIVASDGAAAAVDRYGLFADWAEALRALDQRGAAALLADVEHIESQDPHGLSWPRSKPSDDKTLVVVRFR